MKITIVNKKDIENRLDSKYYIAKHKLKERVKIIKQKYKIEDILKRTTKLPSKIFRHLEVLSTTNAFKPQIDGPKLISKYPYLSFAIITENLNKYILDIKSEIQIKSDILFELQTIEHIKETTDV